MFGCLTVKLGSVTEKVYLAVSLYGSDQDWQTLFPPGLLSLTVECRQGEDVVRCCASGRPEWRGRWTKMVLTVTRVEETLAEEGIIHYLT